MTVRPTVYIETSVISYLAARPSRDLVTAAHQQLTHTWWHERREEFELVASQVVLDEAAMGDADVARKRLELLESMVLLEPASEAGDLAEALIRGLSLPPRAAADAAHIAIAAFHGVAFLLTWNCSHIANAVLKPKIEKICKDHGYSAPVLCTPEELKGAADDD